MIKMIDLLKGSTLFPVCRTLSARNPILELSPGLKFRIHVYCDPNTKIDPNSFIRLKSASGKNSQIFQFAKSAEKRFKQNCEQFEVSCFDFAAKDIGSIVGGIIWTNGSETPWFCHQIQIQSFKILSEGKSSWSLAKIFTVHNWIKNNCEK